MTTVSESEAETDLAKHPEVLLKEIYRLKHHQGGANMRMTDTIKVLALSSCISILISREAEKQSKRLIGLTWGLIVLTIALLFIAWRVHS